LLAENTKIQAPNPKQIPTAQTPGEWRAVSGWDWHLGIWGLFGFWDLDFGICSPFDV
jgi:hypothetical protein